MIVITAYECQFCHDAVYKIRGSCRRHEKRCWWNPVRKACVSCGNFEAGTNEDTGRYYFWCEKYEKHVMKYPDKLRDEMKFKNKCPFWEKSLTKE